MPARRRSDYAAGAEIARDRPARSLPAFDLDAYRDGHLTPVFFGSALKDFCVAELLEASAPGRRRRARSRRSREPSQPGEPRSPASSSRSRPTWTRTTATASPSCGCARAVQARHEAEASRAPARRSPCQPDLLLRPGPRAGRRGGGRRHHRHPQPRHAARRRHPDRGQRRCASPASRISRPKSCAASGSPTRSRPSSCAKALEDLAEEGVAQVFRPLLGADWIVGVVGPLQLDVLAARIAAEYGVAVGFEIALRDGALGRRREPSRLKRFVDANAAMLAEDRDGARSSSPATPGSCSSPADGRRYGSASPGSGPEACADGRGAGISGFHDLDDGGGRLRGAEGKPWNSLQPSAVMAWSCSLVSTPSAVVLIPRLDPRPTTARTIARLSSLVGRSRTKDCRS